MTKETGFPWEATTADIEAFPTCMGCLNLNQFKQRVTYKENGLWHTRCYSEWKTKKEGTNYGTP